MRVRDIKPTLWHKLARWSMERYMFADGKRDSKDHRDSQRRGRLN